MRINMYICMYMYSKYLGSNGKVAPTHVNLYLRVNSQQSNLNITKYIHFEILHVLYFI